MKNVFSKPKPGAAGPPPGTSSVRLGTASRAAQQLQSINTMGAPPGSASRRLQTGAVTGQRRPTTAVQGAGFMTGSLGSNPSSAAGPNLFEKKEETYVEQCRTKASVATFVSLCCQCKNGRQSTEDGTSHLRSGRRELLGLREERHETRMNAASLLSCEQLPSYSCLGIGKSRGSGEERKKSQSLSRGAKSRRVGSQSVRIRTCRSLLILGTDQCLRTLFSRRFFCIARTCVQNVA